MLTREQILTLPAEQLAEVSARMMGFEPIFWFPSESHDHARKVADWVLPRIHEIQNKARFRVYKALEFLFDEIGEDSRDWHLIFHTPEQLTRAALLAFVDNGGEI